MSETSAREQYGPAVASLTPPIDALATVVIGGDPVTTLSVPADDTLAVHVERRENMNSLDDAADAFDDVSDPDEIPEPAGSVPGEVHAEARVRAASWVAVTVGGTRRLKVSASEGDRITVHAERDRTDEVADEQGADA